MGDKWLACDKHIVTLQVTVVGCFGIGVVNRTFTNTTGCSCSQHPGAFFVNASNNNVRTPKSISTAKAGLPNWSSGTHVVVLELDMAAQTMHFSVDGGNREIINGIGPEVTIVKFGCSNSTVATITAHTALLGNIANPDGVVGRSVRAMVLDGLAACDGTSAALATCPLDGDGSGADVVGGGAAAAVAAAAPTAAADDQQAARLRAAQKRLEGLDALHDISFHCGKPGHPTFGIVRANKALLSFRSPVFRAIFFGNGTSKSSSSDGGGGGKAPASTSDHFVENGELVC